MFLKAWETRNFDCGEVFLVGQQTQACHASDFRAEADLAQVIRHILVDVGRFSHDGRF